MSYRDFNIPTELRNKYLLRRIGDVESMREALKVSQLEVLSRLAHNWKGHGITYGFPEIGVWGAQIELAAKEQKIQEIGQTLEQVNAFLFKNYPLK